jgi:hypothetical protein
VPSHVGTTRGQMGPADAVEPTYRRAGAYIVSSGHLPWHPGPRRRETTSAGAGPASADHQSVLSAAMEVIARDTERPSAWRSHLRSLLGTLGSLPIPISRQSRPAARCLCGSWGPAGRDRRHPSLSATRDHEIRDNRRNTRLCRPIVLASGRTPQAGAPCGSNEPAPPPQET